jgi:hypothetical protein
VVAVPKDAFGGAFERFPLLIEPFLGTIRGSEGLDYAIVVPSAPALTGETDPPAPRSPIRASLSPKQSRGSRSPKKALDGAFRCFSC